MPYTGKKGVGHENDSTADGYLELAIRDREVVAVALDAELVEVLVRLAVQVLRLHRHVCDGVDVGGVDCDDALLQVAAAVLPLEFVLGLHLRRGARSHFTEATILYAGHP